MSLHIFDSVQKTKLRFTPICKKAVKVYVCGPTVYDDAHLGHARSAIVFDLLHRVLIANGYSVIMTKNFTDIDDKIIKKMAQTNQSLDEVTQFYIQSYKNDMAILNVLPNTLEPKATENLSAMIEMISGLIDDENAYVIDDGVYFDTSKDSEYGSLSHRVDDENTQARVEGNKQKKNQKDFALWKFNEDISFDAPFGKGRPGWHIECSAMIDKHLAYKDEAFAIDIHGGGADLLFPHHENEACQTRCAKNQELSKYWMHNGFVNINGEKMSKSLGNSFFLKDALKQYDGEVIRFYMMTTHYRANFSYALEDLDSSKKRLDKIFRLKKRVFGLGKSAVSKELKMNLLEALNDDMNTSKALAYVDEYVAYANETLDKEPKNKGFKKEVVASLEFIQEILGIACKNPYAYFQFGIDEEMKKEIEKLIIERNQAKQAKNYEQSDTIRDKIMALGVSIMDTPQGTLWEKV
ncbi:MAG: cysteine--tRNA ligase [Campylobacterota bacterium]|nr:cysteine--tRNA ligase [Campylobacterota bacterium]